MRQIRPKGNAAASAIFGADTRSDIGTYFKDVLKPSNGWVAVGSTVIFGRHLFLDRPRHASSGSAMRLGQSSCRVGERLWLCGSKVPQHNPFKLANSQILLDYLLSRCRKVVGNGGEDPR
jgi:hypothetical protein